MDAAKSAINKFTSNRGHRTDVDEVVNPAVTSETIKPHRHEETTQAIDREVHQDHYHTTVQPIAHKEVLPEKHTHNMIPVENREFHHGNHDETKRTVQAELGAFKNTSTTHETRHTSAAAATVTGEHVHHHVHETVQPVIHKETVQPEVVHTTIPVHETHHASAQHHGMSALPMKTLDEFTKTGGVLHGTSGHTTHEEYDGAPRPYNDKLTTTMDKLGLGHHSSGTTGTTSHHTSGSGLTGSHHTGASGTTGSGLTGSRSAESGYGNTGSGLTGSHGTDSGYGNTSSSRHTGTGIPGTTNTTGIASTHRPTDSGIGHNTNTNTSTSTSTSTTHKPSLMDRLNPMKDTDRDGKSGIMD